MESRPTFVQIESILTEHLAVGPIGLLVGFLVASSNIKLVKVVGDLLPFQLPDWTIDVKLRAAR